MKIPSINEQGLLLHLDAGRRSSYPGSGATWRDLSGNGYHATLYGATYSPLNGGCMVFDGTDDYAKTANTPFTVGSPFTIQVWVKSPTYNVNAALFGNKTSDSSTVGTSLRFPVPPALYHALKTDTDLRNIGFGIGPTWGWKHLTAMRAADGYNKTYLNGVYVTGASITGVATDHFPYFLIGYGGAAGTYFTGSFGEIKVYQRALSAAEITQNYNATKGRYGL